RPRPPPPRRAPPASGGTTRAPPPSPRPPPAARPHPPPRDPRAGAEALPRPAPFLSEPCPRRVEELFDLAIDLDPARLTTFLDQQRAGDTDQRAAVDELPRRGRSAEATEFLLRSRVAGWRRK